MEFRLELLFVLIRWCWCWVEEIRVVGESVREGVGFCFGVGICRVRGRGRVSCFCVGFFEYSDSILVGVGFF